MLLAPLCGVGCGEANDRGDLPPTYPVSGTVTMNSRPLAGAILNFQLVDGSRGAVGKTDANGRYQLSTFKSNDGAVSGEYRVTVVKYPPPPSDSSGPGDENTKSGSNVPDAEPQSLLPTKYSNPKTSGLTTTVTRGKNTIDFSLDES